MKIKFSKWIQLIIKIALTLFCIWYVVEKIDWQSAWNVVSKCNAVWLLLALFIFLLSRLLGAFRLNIFFKNINVQLSEKANLKLYWLGMFYNIFLPGGLGGDGYKIFALRKKHPDQTKKITAAILLDRVSGVVGIGILSVIYYWLVFDGKHYAYWFAAIVIPAIALYYFIVKKFFPSFVNSFNITFWLGLLVQALQVVCVYCLLYALHIFNMNTQYILLFLLSSLVAVLPVFFGPLGAREVVFVWGSAQFLLNKDQSVCISLLFDFINIVLSLIGVWWVYHSPLKDEKS